MASFTIYDRSALCFRAFGTLVAKLQNPANLEYLERMPLVRIEEEHGRFKIWLGNLGALQRGHASLDYRVRESNVMKEAILKLLSQLNTNLDESISVVSGARLPFELLIQDWSSEEESDDETSDTDTPRSELVQRTGSISEILTSLYQLSFKLRSSSTRPRHIKAMSCKKIDQETGVDLFSQLHQYDRSHILELLRQSRRSLGESQIKERAVLIDRLANANTLRRRQFHYWRKHGSKLAQNVTNMDDSRSQDDHQNLLREETWKDPEQALKAAHLKHIRPESTPSLTAHTIHSGTEATTYDKKLDDLETQSVVSYATTTYDSEGKSVTLPTAPSGATKGSGFVCPYCLILCPPRHGVGRAWRAHLLHDLQPYVCTYPDCSDRMYSSRRIWLEHEGSVHRKVWRCFNCSTIFKASGLYRTHLVSTHAIQEDQVEDLVETAETYLLDNRDTCPLCAEQVTPGPTFHHHLAHHLESIACFTFPRDIDTEADDSHGGSNTPQAQSEESTALSLSLKSSFASNPVRDTAEDITPEGLQQISMVHPPVAPLSEHGHDSDSDDDLFFVQPRRNESMSEDRRKDVTKVDSPEINTLQFRWTEGNRLGNGTWSKSSSSLAINLDSGDLMVVKKVQFSKSNQEATSPDGRLRMQQHLVTHLIDIVKDLKHVNFVQYLGTQLEDNKYSIFMEYVPGGSLGNCVKQYGKFPDSMVASCMGQILNGLEYLHWNGILHRELKTDKIFIDNKGCCKIGWSFRMDKVDDAYGAGSKDAVFGTAFWLAPEVVQSSGLNYTGKSDVWSLGGIALELFTGSQTTSKEQLFETISTSGTIFEAPRIPEDLVARLDANALMFLYDCFVIDPAERPTASTLKRSPFLKGDPNYNFQGSMLAIEMQPAPKPPQAEQKPSGQYDGQAAQQSESPWEKEL